MNIHENRSLFEETAIAVRALRFPSARVFNLTIHHAARLLYRLVGTA